jgi:hypothetical protein
LKPTSGEASSESNTREVYVYYVIVHDEGLLPKAKKELYELVNGLHDVESEDDLKYDMRYDDQTEAFILGVFVDVATERSGNP